MPDLKKDIYLSKPYYYVAGASEGDKTYFDTPESFLFFLRNNPPGICGSDELTKDAFSKLPEENLSLA